MSETMTPGEMVEALDDMLAAHDGLSENDRSRIRAAAAFIRSTMEAVEHVLQSIDWEETSTHMAPSIDEKRAFDIYHRLRTLTGAPDER